MNKLHSPNTEAGRAFNETGPSGDSSDVRELGGISVDNTSVVDEYSVSMHDKQELGIRDDEQIIYPARDESWGGRRMAQIRRRYGEARQILHPTTGEDPCDHMSNIMAAVPKAAYDARIKEAARVAAASAGQYNPHLDRMEKDTQLFERTPDNIRMRLRMNAESFQEMGIGAEGPTAGMSLKEGLDYYREKGIDVNQLADEARTGGMHREDNRENWKAAMRGEKRSFNIAADYAPDVTPKSALGQVREGNRQRASQSSKSSQPAPARAAR